ncbi:MAG TPA: hypothetical protein VM532_03500 [Burkholderiales bacterium]|nr:hypothetical protein [Burkholderiales bacterium]
MNLRSRNLANRREGLLRTIAIQRQQLEYDFEALQGPAHILDRIRDVGAYLRERLPMAALIVAAIVVISRGRIIGKVVRLVGLGRRVSRWWAIWKMASALLPRVMGRR